MTFSARLHFSAKSYRQDSYHTSVETSLPLQAPAGSRIGVRTTGGAQRGAKISKKKIDYDLIENPDQYWKSVLKMYSCT